MSNISDLNSSLPLFPFHCAQENVYFEQVISPTSPMYNIGCYSEVHKAYDLPKLQQAWQLLIDHADALRLELVQQGDGAPLQRVLPKGSKVGNIAFIDFSNKHNPFKKANQWMVRQYGKAFHLERGERYQLAVLKLSAKKYYLFSRFHHLFVDGIGVYRIYEQLNYIYSKILINQSPHFIHYLPQYEVEVKKSHAYLQSNRYQRDKAYWQAFLKNKTPTYLPQYYKKHGSGYHNIALSTQLSYQLRDFCRQSNLSVLTVLLGTAALYFSRYLSLQEVIISTPLHGRRGQQAMRVIGMHSDAVMLALHLDENWSFDTLLSESNKTFKRAIRYSQFPQSHLSRLDHHSQVLTSDISLNYELYSYEDREFDIGEIVHLSPKESHIPLEIRLIDFTDKDNLLLRINYLNSHFEHSEIERLSQTLIHFISEGIKESEHPISRLNTISNEERHILLHEWNKTETNYPSDKTLQQLFEEQVEKTPNNVALVFEGAELTYLELNQSANQLARHIRSQYQVKFQHKLRPDTLIALYVDRSLEMIISILAVLKAGGAYVPIAPEYPQKRTVFMLKDTNVPFVITQSHYVSRLSDWLNDNVVECEQLVVNDEILSLQTTDNLTLVNQATDLAYVIYTSGTTGQPKGVMVEHSSLVNLIYHNITYYPLTDNESILFLANYVFDTSVEQIFLALFSSAKLVVINEQDKNNAEALKVAIKDHAVTHIVATASLIHALALDDCQILRRIVSAGEPTPLFLVRKLADKLINEYGPTEITIASHQFRCLGDKDRMILPIGKAIVNVKSYVLDGLKILPIGVMGELYIGGAGLSRGYLNRPELTVERFIENPFATEKDIEKGYTRLYKTGDLVRYLPDGNLEYLGRNDEQVKIRGHRIELGEIQAALERLGGIKQAVVIDYKTDNSHFLAAYIVPEQAVDSMHYKNDRHSLSRHLAETELSLDIEGVKQSLAACVPEYMLPTSFTVIDEVPLTINGKLDKKALPEPMLIDTGNYTPPRNELEQQLCHIWQDVLGLEQVGIHDNFFRIGGDSISAIRLNAIVREQANIDIPLAELFKYSTIALLAAHLVVYLDKHQPMVIPKSGNNTQQRLSFAQERLWFIERFEVGSDTYHMPYLVQLQPTTNAELLLVAINRVALRHPVLNSVYLETESGEGYTQVRQSALKYQVQQCVSKTEFEQSVRLEIQTPFNLSEQAPLRLCRYDVNDSRYLLLMWHHIAFDGWSTEIFIDELMVCYQALDAGIEPSLPELSISYSDFAIWQRDYLQGEVLEGQLNYWRAQLADIEPLSLPTDKTRPTQVDYCGADYEQVLAVSISNDLRALARAQNTTLFTVMLSAFYLTLSQLSNQQDIIIGVPSDNRHLAQTQSLIGFFVNSLALRTQVSPHLTCSDLIAQVDECVQGARIHQDLPFDKLVNELGGERDLSRHPIFQVMFSVQSFSARVKSESRLFEEVALSGEALFSPAKYDLSLFIDDGDQALSLQWNYALSLFEENRIVDFANKYQRALLAILEPEQRLGEVSLLSNDERHTLLHEWNQTDTPYPQDKTLQQLFEEQVEKTPNNVALVFEGEELTYHELNQ
ncbi:non-ribosomal peptide synthetase, partial [uncultured Shewanella sp.]|uniref:non-ribosomal peptide synthetase n=1 Tax=uncultured Shewanella sp. TaxID=173975 RepID=UPI00261BC14B